MASACRKAKLTALTSFSLLFLRRARRLVGPSLLLLLCFGTVRCADQGADDAAGFPDDDDATGLLRDSVSLNPIGDGGPDKNPGDKLDPLCGGGSCIPDDAEACDDGAGGAGGASSEDTAGAAGGISYNPGDLGDSGRSCQVGRASTCQKPPCEVVRSCQASGASKESQPCVTGADCSPGLACVGEGLTGVCRRYCCQGTESSCGKKQFCDERSLPEAPDVFVPVCLPVDDCPLSDPFPCPDGQECTCKEGRACVVVRKDGTTACTVPLSGRAGDPCTGDKTAECAHGFVCSPVAGCMQLCSTVAVESTCPEAGTCLAVSEFHSELGVCVGGGDELTAAR